jgi:thiamine biosynthesis lipoprotein
MIRSIAIISLSILFISCGSPREPVYIENNGEAQGSTFQIKYLSPEGQNFREEIEDILRRIDLSMSTYVPSSLISQVNKGDTLVTVDSLFIRVLHRSLEIADETSGDFDPTVGPLVHLWGFGFEEIRQDVSADTVQQVLSNIGYESIRVDDMNVSVPEGFTIDFNAIAQGFTVDYIAEFLEAHEINNYMVEVGGEVRARGKNESGNVWRIGVDKPQDEIDTENRFQFIIELKDTGLATSGNYRRFWVDEKTGVRYSHTIDPQTGYPARNQLLSVSIIAPQAMDADAYATVCMVQGLEECKQLLERKNNLEGYLIYSSEENEWNTFITKGFQSYIVEPSN